MSDLTRLLEPIFAVYEANTGRILTKERQAVQDCGNRVVCVRLMREVYAPRLSPDQFEAGMAWIDRQFSEGTR